MLNAAGWNPATELPVFVPDTVAAFGQMAEVLQADLASLGVRSTIHKLGQADFVARLQRGQFRGAWLLTVAWMNLSPATFFHAALPVRVPNSSNFVSPEYAALIDLALQSTHSQASQDAVSQLTDLMLDEAFILFIAESATQQSGPEVARATVRDIATDHLGEIAYEDVWLSK
jgi:peptide/nickel transport system substrate-binding protein